MNAIAIQGLVKHYRLPGQDGAVAAVDQVDLQVEPGSTVALLGPSGCGKTTTLRCVAGLEVPDAGRISIGEAVVFDAAARINVPPHRRRLGMVFQSYALWPHLRVAENVAFPLRRLGLSRAELADRVRRVLESVDIARLTDRYPGQLSGGQQQRVALARALVGEPAVILFDEPLSNLDTKLREQMRWELGQLQCRIGFTAVYVTHDRAEALTLAHQVVVMSGGRIVQHGTPEAVYRNPRHPFVADFMGDVNLLPGHSAPGERTLAAAFGPVHAGAWHSVPADALWPPGQPGLCIAFRPESAAQAHPARSGVNAWPGVVPTPGFLGPQYVYVVELAGALVKAHASSGGRPFEPGETVTLVVPPEQVIVYEQQG